VADAFHQVAIRGQDVGVVIDDGVAGAVEGRGQVRLRYGHAYRRGEALAQRAGGGLNARGLPVFGMAGRCALPLAELLEILQGDAVAGQVEQAVQQHAPMPGGQDEPIAIRPLRIRGVVLHELRPQHIRHRRCAHRQAGVAAVGFLNSINRQHPDGVDAEAGDVHLGRR